MSAGDLKMPRLGRARRKTRPSRCGHSVGLFIASLRLLIVSFDAMSESNARAIGSGAGKKILNCAT
jgi:hypothetical protein